MANNNNNNNNEKETMTQVFSCEDVPKSLKNQGSFLRGLKVPSKNSTKFFLKVLKRFF